MALPLLAFGYRQGTGRAVRAILGGLMVLGFLAALSSWSRGGLLSASLVAVLLVWHSERKRLAIPILLAAIVLAYLGLPDAWLDRMRTMGAPELEGSAATRLALWKLGWAQALQQPWAGSGFGGWVYLSLPTGGHRVWHSAYVDMLVEHGFPGLILWGALLFGTVASLTRLIARDRRRRVPGVTDPAAMLRASILAYMVGAGFLSIAHWQLLYLLLAAAILASRFARAELAEPAAVE
jgi:O-antigen ligase